MNTNTDLANRALAHIGEMRISDIEDAESKAARTCKGCLQAVIDEVLREHRWNCAIKRVSLSQLAGTPAHGFARAFQLPGDFLRLLEVNGEQFGESDEFFEIEDGSRLLTDADKAEIRYVRRIGVAEFDPLLAKAVSAALAAEICIPLNLNLQMQAQLEGLKARAISRAQRVDAIEVGSREVRPIERLLGNSLLIRARGARSRNPLRYDLP
jgi:hypothetical protein